MGVGGNFWDLLGPYVRQEGPDAIRDKRVAIDLCFWIVQQETAVANSNSYVRKPHLRLTFFRIINLFSKYGAYPVFVVDGTPSHLKSQARIARFSRFTGLDCSNLPVAEEGVSVQRNQVFLNLVQECSELVALFGMPLLKATGEAEALCAQLNHEGYVDACITADSDAFLFGAQRVIKSIRHDSEEPFECYYMSDIEAGLGLKRNHLIAVSILVGNDHNLNGVPGIGIDRALRFVGIFGDHEILNILRAIRDGDTILPEDSATVDEPDFSLTEIKIRSKPSHCMSCGHPGTKKLHMKSSCEYCGIRGSKSCKKKGKGFICICPFCKQHQEAKTRQKLKKFTLNVCNKIRMMPCLPIAEITELYLHNTNGNYTDGDPCLSWSSPNIDMLIDFLAFHVLLKPSYIREKMFPVLSTIYLRNKPSKSDDQLLNDQYEFHSIQGIKVRYGHKSLVVKWRKAAPSICCSSHVISVEEFDVKEASLIEEAEDPGDEDFNCVEKETGMFLLTEENVELVRGAFPEEVSQFLKEKESKEQNRKRRKGSLSKEMAQPQNLGSQLQITEFYRSNKMSISLKKCEADSKDSTSRHSSIPEETSPNPTRRRLLFD